MLSHVTQADAVMAKFDGDGDGKLDYQVFYDLNIQDYQKIFFSCFYFGACFTFLTYFRSSRYSSDTRKPRIVLGLSID